MFPKMTGYKTLGSASPSAVDAYSVVVVGKTGNGKSSLCNAILGKEAFRTGRSLTSATKDIQTADVVRDGKVIKVVDTPDFSNKQMSSMQDMEANFQRLAASNPLVVLAVRCDVRYTAEEYKTYLQIKRLWGGKFLENQLVVAFTFGDRQDDDIDEELHEVCPELKNVLTDAGGRYIVFDQINTTCRDNPLYDLMHPRIHIERRPTQWRLYRRPFCVLILAIGAACLVVAVVLEMPYLGIALLISVIILVLYMLCGANS